ncbi:hypothetical protein AB6A40_000858 [Gnathostoma spinigerum]|uniref:Uncharacterized protein n=1 Tax=Gnathostoma spinigerum TaxID=75299 RepID=A0ABD6E9W6_9BILA
MADTMIIPSYSSDDVEHVKRAISLPHLFSTSIRGKRRSNSQDLLLEERTDKQVIGLKRTGRSDVCRCETEIQNMIFDVEFDTTTNRIKANIDDITLPDYRKYSLFVADDPEDLTPLTTDQRNYVNRCLCCTADGYNKDVILTESDGGQRSGKNETSSSNPGRSSICESESAHEKLSGARKNAMAHYSGLHTDSLRLERMVNC